VKSILFIMSIAGTLFLGNAFAGQDSDTKALTELIQAMEKRITALESRVTFASFMPDFAERFHVMHRATQAEDWAVASHELGQMKELVESSTDVDAIQGQLFQAMIGPVLDKMDSAIDSGDKKKMDTLLGEAVQTCNSCHAATGSPAINVRLDATEAMSIRHPHTFTKQGTGQSH